MIITEEFIVTGMKCNGCETIIEEAVNQIDGIHHIKADYPKATVLMNSWRRLSPMIPCRCR